MGQEGSAGLGSREEGYPFLSSLMVFIFFCYRDWEKAESRVLLMCFLKFRSNCLKIFI